MFPKQIAYIFFGIIALLSVLFGYNIYSNYQKNILTEKKINKVISKFEEKFKNDSIYLAKANKLLIDKISQHIIDSISTVYEKELEIAVNETNKYKDLLIANNIKFKASPQKSKIDVSKSTVFTNNVKSYKNTQKEIISKPLKKRITNNVTTYSKLKNVSDNTKVPKSNVTTYSKLEIPTKNTLVQNINNNNIDKTTNGYTNKKSIPFSKNSTSNNLSHNNYLLDFAKNINNIDIVPVFPGCENKITKKNKKNCFAVKISRHILSNFDANKVQNIGLEKGIHKARVLFVVDENGNTKIGKLVGKWPHEIYETIKNSIESTPKMKPGIASNKPVAVKYSLLIPFIIK